MKHYDITIIGAGPAGSTLARELGKKYKVLLVDKRPLDKEASKLTKTVVVSLPLMLKKHWLLLGFPFLKKS